MKIARVKVAVGAKSKAFSKSKTVRAPKTMKAKVAASQKKKSADVVHPPYVEMIKEAIKKLCKIKDGKTRFSKSTILDYVHSHFRLSGNYNQINARLCSALKRGVATGLIAHPKGIGANGSFKLPIEKHPMVSHKRH